MLEVCVCVCVCEREIFFDVMVLLWLHISSSSKCFYEFHYIHIVFWSEKLQSFRLLMWVSHVRSFSSGLLESILGKDFICWVLKYISWHISDV